MQHLATIKLGHLTLTGELIQEEHLTDCRRTTALSHTTDIRSSIPLVPSGIRVKSSLPIAFCAVEKLA